MVLGASQVLDPGVGESQYYIYLSITNFYFLTKLLFLG